MLYDVELATSAAALTVKTTMVPTRYDALPAARALTQGRVGYLLPWGAASAALAAEALQSGVRMRSVGGAFVLNGRRYPIGTVVIRLAENGVDIHSRLQALAVKHGAEVVPIDSTYIESGTSLGSNETAFLKSPRVLLVWDTPTQSLSAGWTRYALERRFGQNVTAVRTASLGRAVLSDFDVIVMPSGNYGTTIPETLLARLKDWLRAGGTLVTMAEASRWATGDNVGLLTTKTLLKNGNPDVQGGGASGGAGGGASGGAGAGGATGEKPSQSSAPSADKPSAPSDPKSASSTFDYDKAIQPERERPDAQPGAILRVTVDTDHWLSAGQDSELQVMIEGNRVFGPLKLDSGRNVGIYAKRDRLIASGLVWPENQDLLVQKAYLMHQPFGQGHVIAFAEDPNYRAFTEATMLLFMNAVLLGPGY
jgi:hypothetical protein